MDYTFWHILNFIDDLILECTDENIGTEFKNMNLSIIVYADDIILLSPVYSHLQKLLNICEVCSKNWRIKFNASKSNIIEFGKQFFANSIFKINDFSIPKANSISYLGATITNDLNFNKTAVN